MVLQLLQPVRRGDGVVFDRGTPQEQEQGGAVYDVLDERGGRLLDGGQPGEPWCRLWLEVCANGLVALSLHLN